MSKKFNFGEKYKNPKFMKRSIFTILFTVVLIGLIIAANIFATTYAQNNPTSIDVSTEKSNTLTLQNIEFIQGIENPVEIIVCATEQGYRGAEMVNYASEVYYVKENPTTDNYFNQTINLLQSYHKYNDKIGRVQFIDPQKPEFKEIESQFDVEIAYGDILIRSTRPDENGKETTFEDVITFEEVYELYDPNNGASSMYGMMTTYVIAASNLETAVSSSIFTVAASSTKKIGLLTNHSTKNADLAFTDALSGYNFEKVDLSVIENAETLKNIDTVLLVEPVSDLTPTELESLEAFLDNNGKRGKNFMVFGSTASPNTPNLNEFLEEWGIKVEDGMAYDTNAGYRLSDGKSMLLFNKENELTKGLKASELSCYCADNVALSIAFDGEDASEGYSKGTRTANVLMSTSVYGVKAPKGVSGYTASSKDVLGEMPIIIATSDTTMNENYDKVSSYVTYFASSDFIDEAWTQFGDNGNMDYAITVANVINGRSGANMYFYPKITGLNTMNTPITEQQSANISTFGIFVLPLLLVIGGVVVWFLRRRR